MLHIFNQRLAGFLMLNGFRLQSVDPNGRKQDFNIFSFEKSDAISRAIDSYQAFKKIFKNDMEEKFYEK